MIVQRAAATLPDAPDSSDSSAERIALAIALGRLPRRQREVITLRYLVGLPEADVAAALGVVPLEPPRDRGDQQRIVDRHDGRAQHVPRRVGLADLQQPAAPEPARPRNQVNQPRPEVDQLGVLGRRLLDPRPLRVVDQLRDHPPHRDVLVVVHRRGGLDVRGVADVLDAPVVDVAARLDQESHQPRPVAQEPPVRRLVLEDRLLERHHPAADDVRDPPPAGPEPLIEQRGHM